MEIKTLILDWHQTARQIKAFTDIKDAGDMSKDQAIYFAKLINKMNELERDIAKPQVSVKE